MGEIHPSITNSIHDLRFPNWIDEIQRVMAQHHLSNRPIHIISSNLFSIVNILSGIVRDPSYTKYLHEVLTSSLERYQAEMSGLGENCISNDVLLFKALELWKSADEGNQKLFEAYLKKRGIYQVKDTSMTGIDAQIIDLAIVPELVDLKFAHDSSHFGEVPIILNVNYAFGDQAGAIMSVMCERFRRRILSVNIMGKAGTLQGEVGN